MRRFEPSAARLVSLAGAALLLGCSEPTEPVRQFRAPLTAFVVPESALPSETVRVTFSYENSCGSREIRLRREPSALEVEVLGEAPPRGMVCLGWIRYSEQSVDIAPSERSGDFTVIFRQPEGADSVRVIRRADVALGAP